MEGIGLTKRYLPVKLISLLEVIGQPFLILIHDRCLIPCLDFGRKEMSVKLVSLVIAFGQVFDEFHNIFAEVCSQQVNYVHIWLEAVAKLLGHKSVEVHHKHADEVPEIIYFRGVE